MARDLSPIEKKTVESAVRFGFTFVADGHFKGYDQGRRVIGKLCRLGVLQPHEDPAEYSFHPTQIARDVIRYGSLEAALA